MKSFREYVSVYIVSLCGVFVDAEPYSLFDAPVSLIATSNLAVPPPNSYRCRSVHIDMPIVGEPQIHVTRLSRGYRQSTETTGTDTKDGLTMPPIDSILLDDNRECVSTLLTQRTYRFAQVRDDASAGR